jgi:inner membrane protein
MTGKTHQLLGITSGIVYVVVSSQPNYNPATFGAVLVFTYLLALLPDIDQPNGKLWHFLPAGHTLSKITDPFIEHRNITHSLLGLVVVATSLHYLFRTVPRYWGIDTHTLFVTSMISYGSHIFIDSLTNEGVPIFFPNKRFFGFPPKPFDGGRVATGKWFENLVIFPAISLFLLLFILSNLSEIRAFIYK